MKELVKCHCLLTTQEDDNRSENVEEDIETLTVFIGAFISV